MIRYSLVLLTAAAVIFSAGCDGECCGTPSPTAIIDGLNSGQTLNATAFTLSGARSHDNNDGGSITNYTWTVDGAAASEGQTIPSGTHEVCLTVTDNDGLTNQSCGTVIIAAASGPEAIITQLPTTCTPGDTLNVSGSTSTGSPVSYAWTPNTIGTTASGTINCPAAGVAQEVCLTVTDSADATDQTCSTVTGVAAEITCNPSITAKEDGTNNIVTSLIAGDTYNFENNVTAENCPTAVCTWSVKSHNTVSDSFFTCLIENTYTGVDDNNTDKHVTLDGTGSTAAIDIRTCASNYDYLTIDLNCTNPAFNDTRDYNLTTP